MLCLELGQDAVNAVINADSLDVSMLTVSLHARSYELCHVCAALTRALAAGRRDEFWVGRPILPRLTQEAA